MPANYKKSKYHVEIIPGIWIDTYDVARAFNITDPAHNHALKKVLVTGGRNEKGTVQDIDEAIWSLQNYKAYLGAQGTTTTCKHEFVQVSPSVSQCKNCGVETTDRMVALGPNGKPYAILGNLEDRPMAPQKPPIDAITGKEVVFPTNKPSGEERPVTDPTKYCAHMWVPLPQGIFNNTPSEKCCVCGSLR